MSLYMIAVIAVNGGIDAFVSTAFIRNGDHGHRSVAYLCCLKSEFFKICFAL